LPCDDLTKEDDPYCTMQGILYGIVAGQNHEIGVMKSILAQLSLPPTDNCDVPVTTGKGGEDAKRRQRALLRSSE